MVLLSSANWTWEITMWLKKKSNNVVIVRDNEMTFGTVTWL